jgi:branched-chain amino acid transport system ATP-binding protein
VVEKPGLGHEQSASDEAPRLATGILELRDVVGGYDAATIVRNVSLSVPAGAAVALLGPNGAGKTTTLRLASGLLRPRSGSVLLDGVDVTRMSPHERAARGLCHVPEGRGIFPALTVRDNLVLQTVRGQEAAGVETAVAAFPVLGRRLKQQAGTMSGGEQQMLALASALVRRPRVVLVDEASLGLAPMLVDTIFSFLGELTREGTALLLVEQYVTRALELAQYVYLLEHGSIVFSGTSAEVAADAIHASYLGVEAG